MEGFKNLVMTFCMMGLASVIVDIAAPGGSTRKQLVTLMGLITVLSVFASLSGDGFRPQITELSISSGSEELSEELGQDMTDLILEEAAGEYEEYFMELMNRNNIGIRSVRVELRLNSDNEVEIDTLSLGLEPGGDRERAAELVREQLPDIEPFVFEEMENETSALQ